MIGTAEFTMGQEFFEEFYRGWISHVRPWKRVALPAAVSGFGAGLAILLLAPQFRPTGYAVTAISLIETMRAVTGRTRWLRRMKTAPGYGSRVMMEFDEAGSRIKSATSESRLEWRSFLKWIDSPQGLYLQPLTGAHFYVPYRALTPPSSKAVILAKLKTAQKAVE